MESKQLQNLKQQIQIITYNDYKPSQLSDRIDSEQGVKKEIKMVAANTYVSNAIHIYDSYGTSA